MEIKILPIVWGEIEEAAFTQLPTWQCTAQVILSASVILSNKFIWDITIDYRIKPNLQPFTYT